MRALLYRMIFRNNIWERGCAKRNPLKFCDLFFGIIAATGLIFTATAGYFHAVKTAIATFRVVAAFFNVALNRKILFHNTLLLLLLCAEKKVLFL